MQKDTMDLRELDKLHKLLVECYPYIDYEPLKQEVKFYIEKLYNTNGRELINGKDQ